MFCPQCGNSIPDGKLLDGAAFCPKCGNRIEQRSAQRSATMSTSGSRSGVRVGGQKSSLSSNVGFTPYQIAILILGALALLFAFLPWFESSSSLLTAGNFGNALGQFGSAVTGKNYNVSSFSESYSVFSFIGLLNDLSFYSSSLAQRCGDIFIFAFLGWLVAVVVLAAGIIGMLLTPAHMKTLLMIGVSILLLVCFFWVYAYGALDSSYGVASGSPTFALLCALCCFAVIGVAIVSKATGRR